MKRLNDYDLLIVGNGFDLHCGYNTSYKSFLISQMYGNQSDLIVFLRNAYDNGYYMNDEWNGFEKLICQYLQFINFIFTDNSIDRCFEDIVDYPDYTKKYRYYKIKLSTIPNYVLRILSIYNPLNKIIKYYNNDNIISTFSIEDLIKNDVKKEIKIFVNIDVVDATNESALEIVLARFKEQLDVLEVKLKEYIKKTMGNYSKKSEDSFDFMPKKVLSFNYTYTVEKMFGLSKELVTYVHGDLDNDIILGIEHQMIENQTFDEKTKFIYFFKSCRRLLNRTITNFNSRVLGDLNSDSIIGIYGHSLDLSDKSILLPIFEKKYKKYEVYCYGGIDEYKYKLIKMLGLDLYNQLEMDNRIDYISI